MKKVSIEAIFSEKNYSRLLIITIVLFFYKNTFWPLTYLFITSLIVFMVVYLTKFRTKLRIVPFLNDFRLPLIVAGIFILEFVLHKNFSNKLITKEIFLIICLFFFFYLLFSEQKILKNPGNRFFLYSFIILLTATIAVLNIIIQFSFIVLPESLYVKLKISKFLTIASDYNFYCLFMLFGLIILNYKKSNAHLTCYSGWVKHIINFILIISILLSGSKRGIIAFLIIFMIYALYMLYTWFTFLRSREVLKNALSNVPMLLAYFLLGFLLISIIPERKLGDVIDRYSTIFNIDPIHIGSVVKKLRTRNGDTESINTLIGKSAFAKGGQKNWTQAAAPGTLTEFLDTPYGDGVKITRELGDNGGFSLCYDGPKILYFANHNYLIKFKIKFIKGSFDSFNIGWWVDDGNYGFTRTASLETKYSEIGDGWYQCSAQYTFIDNHCGIPGFINCVDDQTSFIISDFELIDSSYNSSFPKFVFKGRDNELVEVWMNKINPPYYDPNNLLNNGDFSLGDLFWRVQGSQISIKVHDNAFGNYAEVTKGIKDSGFWALYYAGRKIDFIKDNIYQLSFRLKLMDTGKIPFNIGFWPVYDQAFNNGVRSEIVIDTLENDWLKISALYKHSLGNDEILFPIVSRLNDVHFQLTDISLINLTEHQFQNMNDKPNLVVSAYADRTMRWNYAVELWKTEYNRCNKFLGGGFDYSDRFGLKFNNGFPDYPHNPIVSIILYSGIIGVCIYTWLILRVINIYLRNVHEWGIVFICFILTFFFSFFSGNDPFDPPIMGFFIMIPFLMNSFNKNHTSM